MVEQKGVIQQPTQTLPESRIARDRLVASQMWETALNFLRSNPQAAVGDLKDYFMQYQKYRGLPVEIVGKVIDQKLSDARESTKQHVLDYALRAYNFLRRAELAK